MHSEAISRPGTQSVPDAVLPVQFFQAPGPYTGARHLMLAALEDAIDCVRLYALRGGRRRRPVAVEARAWLASGDRSHPFAFESICDTLDLDAGAIRRWIAGWGIDDPVQGKCTPSRVRRNRVASGGSIRAAAA